MLTALDLHTKVARVNNQGMPGEPEPKSTDGQRDSTLDYATRVGAYPQKTAHPPLVLFVLMLTALAGIWSVIIGTTSLGDFRLVGLLQIGAGMCLCWGTIGKLSATNLRPKGALGVLVPGVVMLVAVVALANQVYAAEQAKHPNFQLTDQGRAIRLPSEDFHLRHDP